MDKRFYVVTSSAETLFVGREEEASDFLKNYLAQNPGVELEEDVFLEEEYYYYLHIRDVYYDVEVADYGYELLPVGSPRTWYECEDGRTLEEIGDHNWNYA